MARPDSPFRTVEEALADGPQRVGSAERTIDRLLGWRAVHGHGLRPVAAHGFGVERAGQPDRPERSAEEVAPVVRREAPTGAPGVRRTGPGSAARGPPGPVRGECAGPDLGSLPSVAAPQGGCGRAPRTP
ncbi:hypothetical protein Sdia_26600 [Streptomyces diastaticus subsp. diastaticus]|uniref:Uncharacterized protein n=1 Tax=Streptomyces diastaticus subsp. diastaticus TaxID=68040 RepID=A0ABQ1CND1_STRDI|nr:hypothetical protein Srut_31210 [Streptomyces rutgersensis]GFH71892.1 hypothetical protein Sdia_26600 [Streptomyces diastaticus subsp. diastaticus]GGU40943.1 hypothetical protein GCM10015534_49610 [Streptomyces diastaticus subsp. diastaticus]